MLTDLLIVTTALLATAAVVWALFHKHRFLTYPCLASVLYLGWFLPQAVLISDAASLPSDGVFIILTMACLALLAIFAGWYRPEAGTLPQSVPKYRYDATRLLVGAVALSLVGACFSVLLWSMPEETLQTRHWRGPQTIYNYLARAQWYGLMLAWLLWLRQHTTAALVLCIFNLAFLLEPVFLGARRAGMAELALMALCGLWFVRRWLPSRAAFVAGAIGGVLLVNAIHDIRQITLELQFSDKWPPLSEIIERFTEIDYLGQTTGSQQTVFTSELALGAVAAAAANRQGVFTFGTDYWDAFIDFVVPGQIVGYGLKSRLQFGIHPSASNLIDFRFVTGLTVTGFYTAFAAFWFFGVLIFACTASVLRWLWNRASQGELWAQYAYPIILVNALHVITHRTSAIVDELPIFLVASLPIFVYARKPNMNRPAFVLNAEQKPSPPAVIRG